MKTIQTKTKKLLSAWKLCYLQAVLLTHYYLVVYYIVVEHEINLA